MAAETAFRTNLIAPCGMDCAICMAYLRVKNRCEGWYAPDRKCNKNRTISTCEKIRDRYRHEYGKFSCNRLRILDTRYRTKYHMSMLGNLAAIGNDGVRAFVVSERERWTCKTCGGTIDVHHYRCSACGKELE